MTGGVGSADAWAMGLAAAVEESAAMTMVHSPAALSPCLQLAYDLLVTVAV